MYPSDCHMFILLDLDTAVAVPRTPLMEGVPFLLKDKKEIPVTTWQKQV